MRGRVRKGEGEGEGDVLNTSYLGPVWGAARRTARVRDRALQRNKAELRELERGEVLTPPALDAESGHKVMRVHEHVHESVEEDRQEHIA